MLEVNLFDMEFSHTEAMLGYITCSDTLKPTKIRWLNKLPVFDGITVFTERYFGNPIVKSVQSKLKIFWLIEPRALHPHQYDQIIQFEDDFDYILTYDTTLLSRGPKYVKYVVAQSRILTPEIKPKNKLVSLIASNKFITEGHRFRHEIVKQFADKYNIELWGSAYRPFTNKEDALSDYYFSISIMNSRVDNFFTEVLVDNFRVGTVPIFWGCSNIGEYFDDRGIITFNTTSELESILTNLTPDDYYKRLDYIKQNLIISNDYISTDDIIADILNRLLGNE